MKKAVISIPWGLLAALAFVYCLINSAAVAEGCRVYLRLCGERVVPALFVFSVLAALVCKSPLFDRLCAVLGTELSLLIMGMLGGFPLGASVAMQLYESGRISKKQAEYLCAFTNNPSLSFIISYTGGVLGSARAGVLLAFLTFTSSIVAALALRYFYLPPGERKIRFFNAPDHSLQFARVLRECCDTMIVICGCVIFFGGACTLLPTGVRGFLELSGGIAFCQTETEAAILLGFGGISVLCQLAALCRGRISLYPYFAVKLLQSALMGVGAYFFI